MIFVTVGTHEQPMDRLVRALDALSDAVVPADEPIVVQAGPCALPVRRVEMHGIMAFGAVQDHLARARIVVTHGGPATIMQALSHGKVPIVVPRQSRHGEHVDDHQVRFVRRIADRVVLVMEMDELGPALRDHAQRAAAIPAHDRGPARAAAFAARLDTLCRDLVGRRGVLG
ncbi:MAG: EpsIG, putative glycosyltransferase [Pseudomonadota bacterium]